MQRTLKYAILGLLNQNSMSGYDISAKLEGSLKEFWSANHSQIYPELKKLTEEGLVEFKIEITGSVLERKVYTLTAAGKEDFTRWLCTKADMIATPKDVFRLRMFFSNEIDDETCLGLVAHELEQHEARLVHLKDIEAGFHGIPDRNSDKFGDYLVLTGAIYREEAAIRWLKRCAEIVDGAQEKV